MKAIELFFDESGSIDPDGRGRMVVAGLAIKANSETQLTNFHDAVFTELAAANMLAGLCDKETRSHDQISLPVAPANDSTRKPYLRKRPQDGANDQERQAHSSRIVAAADTIAAAASSHNVEIAAFAITFPANTASPISTTLYELSTLTDQSFLRRLEDALEFLLFECRFIAPELTTGIELSVNLATRAAEIQFCDLNREDMVKSALKQDWGHRGVSTSKGVICDTLQASDGISTLASAINRRGKLWQTMGGHVHVSRSCCYKLKDWDDWQKMRDQDDAGVKAKARGQNAKDDRCKSYIKYDLRPRQIHYFADFISNAVYQKNKICDSPTFQDWFARGFRFDATDPYCDAWLSALRGYSNGDRCGALLGMHKDDATKANSANTAIFKERTAHWPGELSGEEYRALFQRIELSARSASTTPVQAAAPGNVDLLVVCIPNLPSSCRNISGLKSALGTLIASAQITLGWDEQHGCFAALLFDTPAAAFQVRETMSKSGNWLGKAFLQPSS